MPYILWVPDTLTYSVFTRALSPELFLSAVLFVPICSELVLTLHTPLLYFVHLQHKPVILILEPNDLNPKPKCSPHAEVWGSVVVGL